METLRLTDIVVCDAIRRGMAEQAHTLKMTYGVEHVTKTAPVVTENVAHVETRDLVEAVGAELIRDVATTMATTLGDGSTTAALITEAICSGSLDLICGGADRSELIHG